MSGPCWHCASYAGLDTSRCHALCNRGGRVSVQARPETGCAFWDREPGADDGGPPADYRGISAGPAVWAPTIERTAKKD